MSHIALYRKWRPQIFEDVVEQEYIIKILKTQLYLEELLMLIYFLVLEVQENNYR